MDNGTYQVSRHDHCSASGSTVASIADVLLPAGRVRELAALQEAPLRPVALRTIVGMCRLLCYQNVTATCAMVASSQI